MGIGCRRAWAWFCVGSCAALLAAGPARADDFDDDFADDFAEEPAATPDAAEQTAPDDPFADDFAQPPAQAAEPDAKATAAPTEAALPEGERSVACTVVDAIESQQQGADPEARARRQRALRSHSSLHGPTGGIHAVDAGGGADKSFRFAFGTEFFAKNGFLVANDHASRIGGRVAFAITPRPYLELAASVVAYATANDAEDPDLFQVLGDMRLFGRGFHRVRPWLTLGGDLELAFLNGVGGIGISGKGTSVGLRGNASFDLREIKRGRKMPLLVRTNLRYYFDNSAKLTADVEAARYANLAAPLPPDDETRNLLTNVERYAFTINRVDSLSLWFGVEAPLNVKGDYYLHPLLEWGVDLPVNRQGYSCPYRPADPDERDGCLAEAGFSARTSILTVGLRFLPPVRGFSVMTAFDIGTTGSRVTVRELAPNSPWMWMMGLTYAYDLRPEPPEVYTRTITVQPRAQPVIEGRVLGTVVEQDTGAPVPGASVRFVDQGERSALLTDDAGSFTSYRFPPGAVAMQLESPDHHPGSCEAAIPEAGGDVEVSCSLRAKNTQGGVRIWLRNDSGGPIEGATVQLRGTGEPVAAVTNAQGEARIEDLPVGYYTVTAEPKGHLARRGEVRVEPRSTATVTLSLAKLPAPSKLRVGPKRLVPRGKIRFQGETDEIDARSFDILAEVADYMIRHPEVQVLEVARHSDNAGGNDEAKARSQRRAEAVRRWLVDAGVEPARLEAVGYGASRPLAPNITPSNRARNRRVVFEIRERE